MDYFQAVVTEFLRAKRSQFVNSEYMINLDQDGTYKKGRHWYCDSVAVDFAEATVYLCEVTYSKSLHALINRLRAWKDNWDEIVVAIRRDSALKGEWRIVPRLFVPAELRAQLDARLKVLASSDSGHRSMPEPIVTSLEDVLPWKYRSWNGQFYSEGRPLTSPISVEPETGRALMADEVVLEVLGEGGGYVITRFEEAGVSRFRVAREDVFSETEDRAVESYPTLREALAHINSGWPQLHARLVHPAFAAEIYELASTRLGSSAAAMEQWAAVRDAGGLNEKNQAMGPPT